jgi:4'-phosphopantetheinyl transferase
VTGDHNSEVVVRVAGLAECGDYAGVLAAGEREKAEGITNDVLRARFVVTRGLRRELLARVTGRRAEELVFGGEEEGKPRLMDGIGWDFNVSHAGAYVAVVVGRGSVGIDLEMRRSVREMRALVMRCFHPDEAAAWASLGEAERDEGFFTLWSAREAAMKCCGLGLAKGALQTRVDPALLQAKTGTARVRREAPTGYVMVVARA